MDQKTVESSLHTSKAIILADPVTQEFQWTYRIPTGSTLRKTMDFFNFDCEEFSNNRFTTGFLNGIENQWGLDMDADDVSTFIILPKDDNGHKYNVAESKLQLLSSNEVIAEDSINGFLVGPAPYGENLMWLGIWMNPMDFDNDAIDSIRVTYKIERHLNAKLVRSLYCRKQEEATRQILKSFHRVNSDEFLCSGHLSDIVLQCEGKDYPAHKLLLSCRSGVFNKMFRAGLKEVAEGRVVIKGIYPEIFEELLRFIYTSQVECLEEFCMYLFIAADQYDVPALRLLCETEMLRQMDVDNALSIFMMAVDHNSQVLKETAFAFLQRNKQILFHDREAFNMFSARYPESALELFKTRRNT